MTKDTFKQKESGFMTYPEGGWRKWFFKSPVKLWRLGLGKLMGGRMVLITHIGRKSGLPRRTLAEYYRLNGKIYVVAAFGRRAQWAKNMLANPHVSVQTNKGAASALAVHVSDDEELMAVAQLFMRKNSVMSNWYLESLDINPNFSDLLEKKDRTYFFRFDPAPNDPAAPPPLAADFVWVWPVLLGLAALWGVTSILSKSHSKYAKP